MTPVSEPVWFPGDVGGDQRRPLHGARTAVADFELAAREVGRRPEWFWDAIVKYLGIKFREPYTEVLNVDNGIPWATWFTGGQLNAVDTLLGHPPTAPRSCGKARTARCAMDLRRTDRARPAAWRQRLRDAGVGVGDAVGVFMPMLPETVAGPPRRDGGRRGVPAAVLRLRRRRGGDAAPGRRGQGAAHRDRAASRRGKTIDMLAVAEEAVAQCPTVTTVLCVGSTTGRSRPTTPLDAVAVDSEHPLFIAYTSGTTGRPKGTVHVHARLPDEGRRGGRVPVRRAAPTTRLFWFTDMGWIMGPWEVVGALANGATLALYEGAPDWPDVDRLWAFLEAHRVTHPRHQPDADPRAHAQRRRAGRPSTTCRRCACSARPASRGTRRRGAGTSTWSAAAAVPSSTSAAAPKSAPASCRRIPVHPIKPMSLGGPCLGMAVDVFDDDGQPLRGAVGELVCTGAVARHDPRASTRTRSATSRPTGAAGPTCGCTATGRRSTTTATGSCTAAATTRSRWQANGSAPPKLRRCWSRTRRWSRRPPSASPTTSRARRCGASSCSARARQPVGRAAGRTQGVSWPTRSASASRPSAVKFTTALPKTRNAKVLRRAVRGVVTGDDSGDLSSLEDPATIEAVREAV